MKATSADYRSMIHTEVHYADEITWGILPLGCGVNGKAVWSMAPGDCEFDPHHPN